MAYRSLQCFFPVGYHLTAVYLHWRQNNNGRAARPAPFFSHVSRLGLFFSLNSSALVQLPLPFYIVTFCLCASLVAPTTQGGDDSAPGVVWRLRCPFYRSSRRVQCTLKRRLYILNWYSHCSLVRLHYYLILWSTLSNGVLKLTIALAVYFFYCVFCFFCPQHNGVT